MIVYAWRPNDPTVNGHVSLAFTGANEENTDDYISWYPSAPHKKNSGELLFFAPQGKKATHGETVAEEKLTPEADNCYKVRTYYIKPGLLDEESMKRWWRRYSGKYRKFRNNSCTVVYKALCVGGSQSRVSAEIEKWTEEWGFWKTADVVKYVNDLQSK